MERLQEVFPGTAVRFRLDRSSRLNDAVDRGTLDLAMYIGDVVDGPGVAAGAIPLTWYAAPGWRRPADGPVPLVVIDSPCTIRRRALQTLSAAGMAATGVGEAAYLAGVLNAVRGGLGVALVAGLGDPPEGLEPCADLPGAPSEPLHLRARPGAAPAWSRRPRPHWQRCCRRPGTIRPRPVDRTPLRTPPGAAARVG